MSWFASAARAAPIGLLSWTPEGMIGGLFRTMGPFAPPPPPGAQPPPLGAARPCAQAFRQARRLAHMERDVLDITAFARPGDWGRALQDEVRPDPHGPGQRAQGRARAASSRRRSTGSADEWNRGSGDEARFEQEYLVSVGTRG